MRKIDEIIVHCAETRPDQDITAANVDFWHKSKGWVGIGYHFFIRLDGSIEPGRPIELQGAHCYGHNARSIGICYAGGMVRVNNGKQFIDTRTAAQVVAMHNLITTLIHCYPTIKKISGHRDYSNKKCPCFDARKEFSPLIEQHTNTMDLYGW